MKKSEYKRGYIRDAVVVGSAVVAASAVALLLLLFYTYFPT